MLRGIFNFAKLISPLNLTFLLLISCKVIAFQVIDNSNFEHFIEKAERLKDVNPSQAYSHLITQRENLQMLSIENRLRFYKVMAEVYVEQAQYQKSKLVANQALALANNLSTPRIIASELLYARGFATESLGDYQGAREDYLNGLEIADSLNDKKFVAIGLVNLGALDYLMEKFDRSLIMFNDALAISQKIQDDELSGFIHAEMGILYNLINQEEKSLKHHEMSYKYYLKAGKIYYAYNTLRNIATNHSINKDYEKAIPLYKEIINNVEHIGNNELIASVYSGMAWAQVKKKNSDPEASYQYMLIASQYIEQAERADIPIAHAIEKGYLFIELGRFQEALDNVLIATEFLKAYENTDQKTVTTISKLNLLNLKADTYYKLEKFQQAYQAQDEFLTFALSLTEKSNFEEVEDIHMRYESEQADIQKKILEQEESAQSLLLFDAQKDVDNRQLFIILFTVIALSLAWVLIKIISGQRKLLIASRTDELTNTANRRRIMQLGETYFQEAVNGTNNFSLIILDVDDFKTVNDRFGHSTGDQALIQLAQVAQNNIAENDTFGRFGGEEFVALLPDKNSQQAQVAAESMRNKINEHKWPTTPLESLSASIGVVSYSAHKYKDFDEMLTHADQLLYQAKHQGKNKVCYDN